jgi:hypothetical protein
VLPQKGFLLDLRKEMDLMFIKGVFTKMKDEMKKASTDALTVTAGTGDVNVALKVDGYDAEKIR